MAEKKKGRYDKSPHVGEKGGGKPKGVGQEPQANEKVKAKEELPAGGSEREKEPKNSKVAPQPDVMAGDGHVNVTDVHHRHAMERADMHHRHMGEHKDMFHRQEREHVEARMGRAQGADGAGFSGEAK